MKILQYIFTFILIVIIQSTFGTSISIYGISPDFFLCFIVFLSLKEGCIIGVYAGFLMGLILDVYSPQILGVSSFAKSIIGFLIGLLDEKNITLHEKHKIGLLFIAAFIHNFIIAIITYSLDSTISLLLPQILPASIYTTLVGTIFILIMQLRKQ